MATPMIAEDALTRSFVALEVRFHSMMSSALQRARTTPNANVKIFSDGGEVAQKQVDHGLEFTGRICAQKLSMWRQTQITEARRS